MTSLTLRLAAWNATANPTHTRVTAVTAYRDGVACGHADGTIWLYDLVLPTDTQCSSSFELYPKCLLSAHQSPIALIKLAETSAPTPEGREGTLISVSEDGDVIVWSTTDGRCMSRVRSPLQGIRPTSLCLQTVDYQSAAEDLLFVAGEGSVAYVLSYPSLELVYEWQQPHSQWVTAQAVRKRKDHFRSELLTCTADGVVRIWSYDEFGLAQQDVFSRATSPVQQSQAGLSPPGANINDGSRPESVDEPESDSQERVMFNLESQFAALGEDHAITQLTVNPFNDDEFLAVSPKIVRLFASRNNELHELLRWRTQRSTDSLFAGAGFLAQSDIVFWDTAGTIFSVCTQFSVEGGSAGMHMARGLHVETSSDKDAVSVATSLCSVPPGAADSVLASVAGTQNARVDVLVSYASSGTRHVLSVIMPVPLSSVSGSANRPHAVPEDAKSGPRNWLGQATPFFMRPLWDGWLHDAELPRQVTSALVTHTDQVAVGYGDGVVQIVPQAQLISGRDSSDGVTELSGHTASITALFEWQPTASHSAALHSREVLGSAVQSEAAVTAANAESRGLLLSASKDLTLRIWDLDLGECVFVLSTQSAPVVFMAGVTVPRTSAAWKESSRHRELSMVLDSLVLAVGSDNSTTLVSVAEFVRMHVTAPYHVAPVRLSLCRNTGDLELHYADGSRRRIPLARQGGSGSQEDPANVRYPEFSVSLAQTRATSGSSRGRWLGATTLSRTSPVLLLDIDVEQLHASTSRVVTEQTSMDEMHELASSNTSVQVSQQVLSQLCSWGVSMDLDKIKREEFGMQAPRHMSLSMSNKRTGVNTIVFPNQASVGSSWCMSPLLNAQRMLAILVLARSVLQGKLPYDLFGELFMSSVLELCSEKKAVEVINYYVGKLPSQIGRRFKPLSLLTLAQYWQSANVARSAPRAVDSEELHALTIVCVIAADFPAQLPVTARSMAATMLQTLMASRGEREQMMAIELLSRGFATFRAHVDSAMVIRRLIRIMLRITEDQGEDGGRGDRGRDETLGRGAVLGRTALVPSSSMPGTRRSSDGQASKVSDGRTGSVSFAVVGAAKSGLQRISALSMPVVSATLCSMLCDPSVDERWRALHAVGVVVQSHAALLHEHLESVASAIVGSLSPKRATERRRLVGAAGTCVRVLERTYACVSFHAETQTLAVGCTNGRCVAFDLRTGTRTSVLDMHGLVAAVSISPLGNFVASFALNSRELSVWDPQPSALAMFAKSLFWPDAEAHGSVAPLKSMTIPDGFLLHSDVPVLSIMRAIKLSWTGDSTVLLQIREASFSLSVS
ncbi:hypothetical protein LPJ76_004022 [Coemansia sp. RSA 638]|nr:hypothetical protein LPJ76_004022 [Coemansia sp. RSA 638]